MNRFYSEYQNLLLAIVLCCCLPTGLLAQLANQVMVVELANRRYQGTTYFAEIWVVMMPNNNWPVCDAIISLAFNNNTLDGTAFQAVSLLDFDPELQAAGYEAAQAYIGGGTNAVVVELFAPQGTYVTKQGGVGGSSFRLGTVRWRVTDPGGQDGLFLRTSGTYSSVMYFHTTGTDCEPYDNAQRGQVTFRPRVSLWINPLGCVTAYYNQRRSCQDELREFATDTPLQIPSPHWGSAPGPGGTISQARYQYNFDPLTMPQGPLQTRGFFNANDVPALTDRARCRWEAQIDQLSPPATNAFEWVQTTTGGRLYFTRDFTRFYPNDPIAAGHLFALTKTAYDPDQYTWKIVDTSACGAANAWFNRSEIVCNNSEQLYLYNPHVRWTTDLGTCGDGPDCINFYAIILHELGHYLGLSHQNFNNDWVMSGLGVWPQPATMTICDADNIRRLYNPSRLGAPVDNSFDCGAVTAVTESSAFTGGEFSLLSNAGEYRALYTLSVAGSVDIDIYNAMGQMVLSCFSGVQTQGQHALHLPISGLASGVYFVCLTTAVGTQTRKFVLLK